MLADHLLAMLRPIARLYAAWDRLPSVEEEDFHGVVVACCGWPGWTCLPACASASCFCTGQKGAPGTWPKTWRLAATGTYSVVASQESSP
jgi:hypothetical protein